MKLNDNVLRKLVNEVASETKQTKKLDDNVLRKLVNEVLNEDLNLPFRKFQKYKKRKLKNHQPAYIAPGKDLKYINKNYLPNDEKGQGYTQTELGYFSRLPAQEAPSSQLELNDIKKLFQILRDAGSGANITSLSHQLKLAKDAVEVYGSDSEKKTYNASFYVLKNRYNLKSKVTGEVDSYGISGASPAKEDFEKNWTGMTFDYDPAATAQTIEPDKTAQGVQAQGSLFLHDLRNYESSIDGGNFDPSVKNAFDFLFKDTTNLFQRLKVLTDFSNEVFSKEPAPSETMNVMEAQKLISKTLILDYTTSMMREMDDRAGAYMFESFLALCAGGVVKGAEADEESGQMGATDFEMAGGVQGSCKYYSSHSGISQAVSGFEIDKPVHYVVAIKDKELENGGKRIVKVNLYYFKVLVKRVNDVLNAEIYSPKASGTHGGAPRLLRLTDIEGDDHKGYVKMGSIKIYSDPSTFIGTLDLVEASQEARQQFKGAAITHAGKYSKHIANAIESLSEVAHETSDLNDNLNFYAVNNEAKNADAAIRNLAGIGAFMEMLFGALGEAGYNKPKPTESF